MVRFQNNYRYFVCASDFIHYITMVNNTLRIEDISEISVFKRNVMCPKRTKTSLNQQSKHLFSTYSTRLEKGLS